MKVCSVQPAMFPTISRNTSTVTKWMFEATEYDADIVLFPELMLTGYGSHLHELFRSSDWYGQIEKAIVELTQVADETGITALVGSPFLSENGYLNALLLIQPMQEPILAGARSYIMQGWKKVWGFVEAQNRSPIHIKGIAVGSIFCAEATCLEQVEGKGLEDSEIILWPTATTNITDSQGQVIGEGCGESAMRISQWFGVPVIQSNFASQFGELHKNRLLGGSVVCDKAGQILQRASFDKEDRLLCDFKRVGDEISVLPIYNHQV
jgi:predicted amidohydrolase